MLLLLYFNDVELCLVNLAQANPLKTIDPGDVIADKIYFTNVGSFKTSFDMAKFDAFLRDDVLTWNLVARPSLLRIDEKKVFLCLSLFLFVLCCACVVLSFYMVVVSLFFCYGLLCLCFFGA